MLWHEVLAMFNHFWQCQNVFYFVLMYVGILISPYLMFGSVYRETWTNHDLGHFAETNKPMFIIHVC